MSFSQIISKKLVCSLEKENFIARNEMEIYMYCFDYLIEIICYTLGFFLIGCFTHRLTVSLLFLFVLLPLRAFGGGIHASSSQVCSFISILLYLFIIIFSPVITPIFSKLWILLFLFAIITILLLAPVETKNRPINMQKRIFLKRNCHLLCLFYIILFGCFYRFKEPLHYGTLALCVIAAALSILLGFIQNTFRKDETIS